VWFHKATFQCGGFAGFEDPTQILVKTPRLSMIVFPDPNSRALAGSLLLGFLLKHCHPDLDFFQFLPHPGHATQVRVEPLVFAQWLNRNAPPHSRANDLARQYSGFRADHGAALHVDVVAETDLAADHTIVLNCHAAADSGLRRDHDALADVTVVADMDQIIHLCAPADARAPQGRPVDASVRSQLNVVFNY